MRGGKPLLLVLFAIAGLLIAARRPSPHWEVEIRQTATGIELKSRDGCDWVQLTGVCDSKHPKCRFIVDERGIRVLPE